MTENLPGQRRPPSENNFSGVATSANHWAVMLVAGRGVRLKTIDTPVSKGVERVRLTGC